MILHNCFNKSNDFRVLLSLINALYCFCTQLITIWVNSHKPLYRCIECIVLKIIQQRMIVVDNFHTKICYTYTHLFHMFIKVVLVSCYQIGWMKKNVYIGQFTRVCFMYVVLNTLGCLCYAVLCISYSKCIFKH